CDITIPTHPPYPPEHLYPLLSPHLLRHPFLLFSDTCPPNLYPLSLHDALPISPPAATTFFLAHCQHIATPRRQRKAVLLRQNLQDHRTASLSPFFHHSLPHSLCIASHFLRAQPNFTVP